VRWMDGSAGKKEKEEEKGRWVGGNFGPEERLGRR
jgi:hypothetical protein